MKAYTANAIKQIRQQVEDIGGKMYDFGGVGYIVVADGYKTIILKETAPFSFRYTARFWNETPKKYKEAMELQDKGEHESAIVAFFKGE